MRHNKSGKRLGRNSSHRKAMMRNMVTSLFAHEKITTTDIRAKELRKIADKMITLGKRGDIHARRQALQVIRDRKVVGKLFDLVAPRYKDRPGGYTRIIKLGQRAGDNAALSLIELVEEEFTAKPRKAAPVAKAEATPVAVEEQAIEEVAAEEVAVDEAPEEEAAVEETAEEKKEE
jgi:large subunit ribosomal protein L17